MKKYWVLVILFCLGLLVSAIGPKDYFTWFLEVVPGIAGFIVLVFTFKSFKFTILTYSFILLHCYVLFLGGHYTYAEVPFFDTLGEFMGQSRNNYDKLGHFVQGFVPAMITREILIRKAIVKQGGWLSFLTACVCLSISAFYELLEWWVAELSGESAEAFLGTQGYVWDTQSDILMALIGAVTMLVLFSTVQDKAIDRVNLKIATLRDSSVSQ